MIGFAPDSRTLKNLDQYVGVIEHAIKRELTPAEFQEAAAARESKIPPSHCADWFALTNALLGFGS